jgi:hypothetical protein
MRWELLLIGALLVVVVASMAGQAVQIWQALQ